uniref:Serine-rich adhesin for platelets-like n=1 Tax=Elaeophora elaphi TaxID=1147741 RepID=A0A0R3S383_9BILA
MAMSSGMYHRRWASAGGDYDSSTTVPRSENITQAITPHTYGTSWNSVRWDKPSEYGNGNGGGYWSRSVPFFESLSKDHDTKSSYSVPPLGRFGSQSTSKNNIELKNSGPYMRERSVRFGDSVLSLMNDKTSRRTSPRLPWLSDNLANRRSINYNKVVRNSRENTITANSRWTPTSSSATRSHQSGVRNAAPALSPSSASASFHDRSFLSNTSETLSSSNHGNVALRADRPWRRRMADAARLRTVHGDEIGSILNSTLSTIRACRGSIPNGRNCTNSSGDELRTSLNALKNYIVEQTTSFYRQNNRFPPRDSSIFTDKSPSLSSSIISVKQRTPVRGFQPSRWNSGRYSEYMSRSHSPIRPKPNAYNVKLSKYNSVSTEMLLRPLRYTWLSNVNNVCENVKANVLVPVIRNSPILENVCERESNSRLLSNKERTLRHHSRQCKLGVESNSSSDTEQQQTEVRKRKLRKRFRKKSNDESRSESKHLPKSAKKRMVITDNEISVHPIFHTTKDDIR